MIIFDRSDSPRLTPFNFGMQFDKVTHRRQRPADIIISPPPRQPIVELMPPPRNASADRQPLAYIFALPSMAQKEVPDAWADQAFAWACKVDVPSANSPPQANPLPPITQFPFPRMGAPARPHAAGSLCDAAERPLPLFSACGLARASGGEGEWR